MTIIFISMFIAIFFGVILLGVGAYFLAKRLEKEEQEGKQYLPDDELIYDPVSGRRLTIEEAESGIILPEDALSRIKSDEEIETFYSDHTREMAYIERDLILSGAVSVDRNQFDWLDRSAMFRQLASFNIHFLYQVAPDGYLGIANIGYRHSSASGSEYQFIGFMSGTLRSHAHQALLNDLELEILPTGTFLRLPRVAARADFDRLLPLIRDSGTSAA